MNRVKLLKLDAQACRHLQISLCGLWHSFVTISIETTGQLTTLPASGSDVTGNCDLSCLRSIESSVYDMRNCTLEFSITMNVVCL